MKQLITIIAPLLASIGVGVAMAFALLAWINKHPCTDRIDLALTGPQLPLCKGAGDKKTVYKLNE